jgi:predicted SAM-dependent methyltransferase
VGDDSRDDTTARFPDATLDLKEGALEELLALIVDSSTTSRRTRTSGLDLLMRVVPRGVVGYARVAVTTAVRPLAVRRIQGAAATRPLKLHLGSGTVRKDGWINIDLLPDKVDVPWNLARGIPFPDGSVDAILHEHLMEHLTLSHGHALARESHRVLRPGGVLRIGVPDAGAVVQSYAGNWDEEWARSAPTGMIAIQKVFYDHGHRAQYDGQTLMLLLRAAGFSEVSRHAFGEGRLQPNVDSPHRKDGTLYVEAVKS